MTVKYYKLIFPTYQGGVNPIEYGKGPTAIDAYTALGYPAMGYRNMRWKEITQEEYEAAVKIRL